MSTKKNLITNFSILIVIFLFFSSNLTAQTRWGKDKAYGNPRAYTTPQPYDNNLKIKTKLTIKGATKLTVRITGKTEKNKDILYITDSNNKTKKFSGKLNKSYSAIGPTITLKFISNHSNKANGIVVSIKKRKKKVVAGRDFVLRKKINVIGNVAVLGNTVLCIRGNNGQCIEPSNNDSNADTNLNKANSSYAELNSIPTGANVVYARIYWQGREKVTNTHLNLRWNSTSKNKAKTIYVKKESSTSYTKLTANVADFEYITSTGNINIYSASADALSVVKGNGKYFIDTAKFYTHTGITDKENPGDGLGAYGAWVLVVVYEDKNNENEKARNITIFDGYKIIRRGDKTNISLKGFLTPKSGKVESKTYVFAAEGDKFLGNTGDVIKMAGLTHNTALKTLGTFDSRIDVLAKRVPNLSNNNGIDIQKYDTGSTPGAQSIITNDEVGAKFQFTSDQDLYFPSLIVFSTQLYEPKLCYDYAYSQYGQYFTEEHDSLLGPSIVGNVGLDEPVQVKLYIRNNEISDITAANIKLNIEDINTSQLIYKTHTMEAVYPGSTFKKKISDATFNNSTNNNEQNLTNIIIKDPIDEQEQFYVYYKFNPQTEELNMPIKAYINFDLQVDKKTIVENMPSRKLGGKFIHMCTDKFNYSPAKGIFNIIDSNFYDINNINKQYYNLPTQITKRKSNALHVISLDPKNLNALKDLNITTSLAIELIDASAFHDINASCQEEDSSITKKKWIVFNKKKKKKRK